TRLTGTFFRRIFEHSSGYLSTQADIRALMQISGRSSRYSGVPQIFDNPTGFSGAHSDIRVGS
ncbi:MAG: hypothetical protein MJ127_05165, partial [Mogibacterium sp.]|nr:hypothetical protein [Mogibacterium sp.]